MLPYHVRRETGGRYVVVNRNYKPVGDPRTEEWVDYEPYAVCVRGVTESVARRASSRDDPDTSSIYLFSDGCMPWKSDEFLWQYVRRLKALFRLKVG